MAPRMVPTHLLALLVVATIVAIICMLLFLPDQIISYIVSAVGGIFLAWAAFEMQSRYKSKGAVKTAKIIPLTPSELIADWERTLRNNPHQYKSHLADVAHKDMLRFIEQTTNADDRKLLVMA